MGAFDARKGNDPWSLFADIIYLNVGADNGAIVGVRGEIKLDDKWFMPYQADIGGGQSQLTWQAFLGVGYKYKWGEVVLGYRYLDYNFKSGWLVEDLSFGGPLLGAKYHF